MRFLTPAPSRGGYRVAVGRGELIGRVASEWFSRPADERYSSLSEPMKVAKGRAKRSRTVESAAVQVWTPVCRSR